MMNKGIDFIKGGMHTDVRGTLTFVNDFDMSEIKRFYVISHSNENVIRAWQGHKTENKWFYCIAGKFLINVVYIDDWENPSPDLEVRSYHLRSDYPLVLRIGGGHATGIKALSSNASLLVFSNMNTLMSKEDDFRFDKNLWFNWNKV